jgi:hypothetical protein
MSNKALVYILNTVLLSTACFTSVMADTTSPERIEKLKQAVTSNVLVKLNMLDPAKPEYQNMSLENVVSEALHAGKSMEEIRQSVSLAMEEVTGKPLSDSAAKNSTSLTVDVETAAQTLPTESATRTIPLTTVLLPNESLSSVAKRIYGPENGRRYLDIYQLNKDEIPNINVIPEGTVLKLPE